MTSESPVNEEAKDRASWLGMNAYGVFIAILVLLIATRYFLVAPFGQHLLVSVGHAGYVLAGLGLLYSYWRASVASEVTASVMLLASNALLLLARFLGIGAAGEFSAYQALITVGLAVAVVARVAALMRGGTFHLPPWRRD